VAGGQITAELIGALETGRYSWIDGLLSSLSRTPDEMLVFRRLKEAARSLALAGNNILVGHGAVYLTRDRPGGVHVRLIAPVPFRVANLAKSLHQPQPQALRSLRLLDRRRSSFFGHYWPGLPMTPELFAATFNTAQLDEERLLRSIAGMLPESS
jgi:hypothetical protein